MNWHVSNATCSENVCYVGGSCEGQGGDWYLSRWIGSFVPAEEGDGSRLVLVGNGLGHWSGIPEGGWGVDRSDECWDWDDEVGMVEGCDLSARTTNRTTRRCWTWLWTLSWTWTLTFLRRRRRIMNLKVWYYSSFHYLFESICHLLCAHGTEYEWR